MIKKNIPVFLTCSVIAMSVNAAVGLAQQAPRQMTLPGATAPTINPPLIIEAGDWDIPQGTPGVTMRSLFADPAPAAKNESARPSEKSPEPIQTAAPSEPAAPTKASKKLARKDKGGKPIAEAKAPATAVPAVAAPVTAAAVAAPATGVPVPPVAPQAEAKKDEPPAQAVATPAVAEAPKDGARHPAELKSPEETAAAKVAEMKGEAPKSAAADAPKAETGSIAPATPAQAAPQVASAEMPAIKIPGILFEGDSATTAAKAPGAEPVKVEPAKAEATEPAATTAKKPEPAKPELVFDESAKVGSLKDGAAKKDAEKTAKKGGAKTAAVTSAPLVDEVPKDPPAPKAEKPNFTGNQGKAKLPELAALAGAGNLSGDVLKMTRSFSDWTLACDMHLEKNERVCTVQQTTAKGSESLSWRIANRTDGKPVIVFEFSDKTQADAGFEVSISGFDRTIPATDWACQDGICKTTMDIVGPVAGWFSDSPKISFRFTRDGKPVTVDASMAGFQEAMAAIRNPLGLKSQTADTAPSADKPKSEKTAQVQ